MLLLGANHNTAALALRERMALGPERLPAALRAARRPEAIAEAMVLSTCNRTEVYCAPAAARADAARAAMMDWLLAESGLDAATAREHCYALDGDEALAHAIRVASGLDSMMLGETQIFGQLKSAVALAEAEGALGAELAGMFDYAFRVAKQVRAGTGIGAHSISVASVAIDVARRLFDDLRQCRVLLVGAGGTMRLLSRHLADIGVHELAIANRTPERAAPLAAQLSAVLEPLSSLPGRMAWADVVFSATDSPLPLIDTGMVAASLPARRHRPLLIMDLAVPSDVETGVNQLRDVYLYGLDDLRSDADRNRAARQDAARQAEAIVRSGVAEHQLLRAGRDADRLIERYRQRAERVRDVELAAGLRAIDRGVPAAQALDALAKRLTQQLMHEPTVQLRRAARERRAEVLRWARDWLGGETPS